MVTSHCYARRAVRDTRFNDFGARRASPGIQLLCRARVGPSDKRAWRTMAARIIFKIIYSGHFDSAGIPPRCRERDGGFSGNAFVCPLCPRHDNDNARRRPLSGDAAHPAPGINHRLAHNNQLRSDRALCTRAAYLQRRHDRSTIIHEYNPRFVAVIMPTRRGEKRSGHGQTSSGVLRIVVCGYNDITANRYRGQCCRGTRVIRIVLLC